MKQSCLLCAGAAALGTLTAVADLAKAGTVFVDLDAARLTDVQEGGPVATWPNAGSEPDFVWVQTQDNAVNPTREKRGDAWAVRFAGSSTGGMTNHSPLPAALTGNQAWTIEGWICPTQDMGDNRDFLCIGGEGGLEDNNLTKVEVHCSQNAAAAVDYYGTSVNWGRRSPEDVLYRPKPGEWCLVTIVHEATGYGRVYVNGHVASDNNLTLNISGEQPSFITFPGIWQRTPADGSSGWLRQGYVDIGQLRIQSGALKAAQVMNNFNEEKARYGITEEPDALWTDGGTWWGSAFASGGRNLVIEGDQPLVIDNGAVNDVHFLTVDAAKDTGLTIDNGSALALSPLNDRVDFGNLNGGTFTLKVLNGTLSTPANAEGGADGASISLGFFNHGVGVIGGNETAAGVVNCERSFRIGEEIGGSAELTVKKNGSLTTKKDLYIADKGAAKGTLTVENGGFVKTGLTLTASDAEVTVEEGGQITVGTALKLDKGQLTVAAGGILEVTNNVTLASVAGETAVFDLYGTLNHDSAGVTSTFYLTSNVEGSSGTFNLHPGAVANIQSIRTGSDVTTTTATLNADSATFRSTFARNRTWLLPPQVTFNFKNEVTFDIGVDSETGAAVTQNIGTKLNDLTEEGTGTFVKSGAGTLVLSNDGTVDSSTVSSLFLVRDGLLKIGSATVFAAGSTASFKLDGGTICADYEGGASFVLSRLDRDSVGSFVVTANNAAENLDFSQYPGVELVTSGTFTYTGKITPFQNKYVFRPTNGLMVYSGNIADIGATPASVEIYGATDLDGVTLAGLNDGMSGMISVFKGILGISGGSEAAGGPSTKLYLAEGTALKLDARVGTTFFTTRIDPASKPAVILLTDNSAACNVDLSLFPGCRLGSDKTDEIMTQTGLILPNADNAYLLGGGAVPYYQTSHPGFLPSTMADAAAGPTRVEVATAGIVNLSNTANSYSGGTSILDSGVVFVTADGFGAVPDEFDEDNIYINGGILRSGNTKFSLAATRGVKVGPDGAELHPWGSYSMEIPGGLTGAGPLKISDAGCIWLSGARNTYVGPVTCTAATDLIIGGAENYSWASEAGIAMNGGSVTLATPFDVAFNDVFSGTGSFRKQGNGTVTLMQPQTYAGETVIAEGKLVLGEGVSLVNSTALRNDGEVVFSSLSALGTGTIAGNGRFTVREGGNLRLDGNRIQGTPSFEVSRDASIEIDAPGFNPRSGFMLDDGASLKLGLGAVKAISGFGDFVCNGSAELLDGRLRLTPNDKGQFGSAFFNRRVKLSKPWTLTYTYQIGDHDTLTEDMFGCCFLIHNATLGESTLGSDVTQLGCEFGPKIGVVNKLGYNGTYYNHYGFFDNPANTGALLASTGAAIVVTLTYDGATLHVAYDCNGTVRTRDQAIDFASALGSDYAWIGFGGCTGSATGCEQFYSNFSFSSDDTGSAEVEVPGPIGADGWSMSKYPPALVTLDDVDGQAFELTPADTENTRTAVWNKNKVRLDRPFTASFKYRVTSSAASGPGYGMTVVLQNKSATTYGQNQGRYGFVHTSAGYEETNAVGYVVNLYKSQAEQKFRYIEHNTIMSVSEEEDAMSGLKDWNLADGVDTDFTLRYDLTNLTITASRPGFSHEVSREVDIAAVVNGNTAWIGFTGGTSTKWSRQLVHSFTFAYDDEGFNPATYANPFVVAGAVRVLLGDDEVGFSNLELREGAVLTPAIAEGAGLLELANTLVSGNATVVSGENVPIVLANAINFAPGTGTLKLVGDVKTNGRPIKLVLSELKGVRQLLDLSDMTKPLTLDDFELAGTVPPPLKMDIQNGILRAWRDISTVLFFR